MNPTIKFLAYRGAVCRDTSTTVQLLVRIDAPEDEGELPPRPDLNLGLSIDRSGSMAGMPIEHARRSAAHLVERLKDTDKVSVVAFDNHSDILVDCRDAADRGTVVQRINDIHADGGTALHQGWLDACRECEKGFEPTRLSRVILLSDGGANVGLSDPDRIAGQVSEWLAQGISTSTVGLGLHYNEDLLSAMARAGNGNFYHVETPEQIEPFFQVELQGLSRTFGRTVSLDVAPVGEVELLRVYNPLSKTEKGRLKLGDLVRGCSVEVVLELLVPPAYDKQDLCVFRLAWTESESGARKRLYQTLHLPVVSSGQLSEFPGSDEVLQKRAVQLSAVAQKKAVKQIDAQDYDGAKKTLRLAVQQLGEARPSEELTHQTRDLTRLLENLERGAYASVRKEATYSSMSLASSSIVLSGGIRKFLALPPEERTPEKLQELMGIDSRS